MDTPYLNGEVVRVDGALRMQRWRPPSHPRQICPFPVGAGSRPRACISAPSSDPGWKPDGALRLHSLLEPTPISAPSA
jgi:hypothetical protein